MDEFDRKLLRILQADATLTQRELADRVGLSQNACWRRVQILREKGIITGEHISLNRSALALDLTVYLLVKTRHHSDEWLAKFRQIIVDIPNVIDFHRLAGDYDYLVKLAVTDMVALDRIYRGVIARIDLQTVTSYISMEGICDALPYPIF